MDDPTTTTDADTGPTTGGAPVTCPSCGEPAPGGATWCEACGHELAAVPKPVCVDCGEAEVDEDGYCGSCGHRQPAERDHLEVQDGPVVAVSNRGKRHRHNEDAVALGVGDHGTAVLVVCDGVSSTEGSAEASSRAAAAARDVLVAGLTGADAVDDAEDIADLLERAVEAAQAEATASAETTIAPTASAPIPSAPTADGPIPGDPIPGPDGPVPEGPTSGDPIPDGPAPAGPASGDPIPEGAVPGGSVPGDPVSGDDGGPPSSTLVAVVARPVPDGTELVTAWVGDSRAYWLGEEERLRLTGDDHELGGSLTRWLGADSGAPLPDLSIATVDGGGHLLVCTDGLWRYAETPDDLGELVDSLTAAGRNGIELASALVDHANDGGGHDNITVALWSTPPSDGPGTPEAPADVAVSDRAVSEKAVPDGPVSNRTVSDRTVSDRTVSDGAPTDRQAE